MTAFFLCLPDCSDRNGGIGGDSGQSYSQYVKQRCSDPVQTHGMTGRLMS